MDFALMTRLDSVASTTTFAHRPNDDRAVERRDAAGSDSDSST
jgi:hypothetical protein